MKYTSHAQTWAGLFFFFFLIDQPQSIHLLHQSSPICGVLYNHTSADINWQNKRILHQQECDFMVSIERARQRQSCFTAKLLITSTAIRLQQH